MFVVAGFDKHATGEGPEIDLDTFAALELRPESADATLFAICVRRDDGAVGLVRQGTLDEMGALFDEWRDSLDGSVAIIGRARGIPGE